MRKNNVTDFLFIGISLALIGVWLATFSFTSANKTEPLTASSTQEEAAAVALPKKQTQGVTPPSLGPVSVLAKAAIVQDLSTGATFYQKDADESLPLASLTKIMAAISIRELLPTNTTVTIPRDAVLLEGDSGLRVGEEWNLSRLLVFSLMTSSNDGIQAAADAVSKDLNINVVQVMNNKAQALGLTKTKYYNTTGLDISSVLSGGYGSVRDLTKLISYAIAVHENLFKQATPPNGEFHSFEFAHSATNTDILAGKIPSLIFTKTGYTDLAGGNLAVVFTPVPGHPVAVIVLGSTFDGRFSDVQTLVNAVEAHKQELWNSPS